VSILGRDCPFLNTLKKIIILIINGLCFWYGFCFIKKVKKKREQYLMDRPLTKKEQHQQRVRRLIKPVALVSCLVAVALVAISLSARRLSRNDIRLAAVERGNIDIGLSTSGTVSPEYQEQILSPISSRILEVYARMGDTVEVGTSLLRLNLENAEADYQRGLDDLQLKEQRLKQLLINQDTRLTDMQMRLRVARMSLDQKRSQLVGERYLDSIGSGTKERVRQAELTYNTASLELEQLQKQLDNERRVCQAELDMQRIEIDMQRKSLEATRQTLADARICSPRRAVLTFIKNDIGASVSQGEQIAIISDLSSYKVEGELSDGYSDRIQVGSRVTIRSGKTRLSGTVSHLNPLTKGGSISFTIRLDNPSHPILRPGLRTEVFVLARSHENSLRLPMGTYYKNGKGSYKLFVVEGDRLVARDVELGEANYDWVEVIRGLDEGEQVVISDMEKYQGHHNIRLK